jgi:hypothetical protein
MASRRGAHAGSARQVGRSAKGPRLTAKTCRHVSAAGRLGWGVVGDLDVDRDELLAAVCTRVGTGSSSSPIPAGMPSPSGRRVHPWPRCHGCPMRGLKPRYVWSTTRTDTNCWPTAGAEKAKNLTLALADRRLLAIQAVAQAIT